MLIGSNAIQMIALRNDLANFSRKADAKIGLLKEVLDRIQNGEEVDVRGLLGTGSPVQEKEWEEGICTEYYGKLELVSLTIPLAVLREIADEDILWQTKLEPKTRRTERRIAGDEQHKAEASHPGLPDEAQANAKTQPRRAHYAPDQSQGSDQPDGELPAFY